MTLRSLEIFGFKSFARRTLMEFAAGVTAVVGPNGTGKSNVADAIRWSMGEQSMRALRGGKTEDVIFGGGEGRNRSGFAEVTIRFDNSDHWLPINYEEVSITRRAFRSGENEYLINGAKSRLKDVQELLRSGGIALGSNMVIGQGEVDAALGLKPEHRRLLIEEGAGVSRYYARRDDARRRLDQTERNLQRLSDLHGELEPRLELLREQAEVASRSNELTEILQTQLKILLSHRLGLAVSAEEKALSARVVAEARLADFETQSSETGVGVSAETLATAKVATRQAEAEYEEYRTRHSNLTAAMRLADQRIEFEERAIHEIDARLTASSEAQSTAIKLVERTEQEVATLQESCSHIETEIRQIGARVISQDQLQDLQVAVTEARRTLASLNGESAHLRELQQSLGGSQSDSELDVQKAHEDLGQSRQALASKQEQLTDLIDKVQESENQLAKSRRDRVEAVEHVSELRPNLEQLRARCVEKRAHIEVFQAERHAISMTDTGFAAMTQGVAALLDRAGELHIRGLLRSALPNIPPELAKVVGVSLGHLLDDVIIDQTDNLEQAIRFLRRGHDVRVRFRPADGYPDRPGEPHPFGQDSSDPSEVVGALDELIGIKPDFEVLLGPLFRNIVVVKNLGVALALSAAYSRTHSYRFVTLDGELVDLDGSVVTSGWGEDKAVDLAARTIEIEIELENAKTQLELLVRNQKGLEEDLLAAESHDKNINKEFEIAVVSEAGARSELRGAEEELNIALRQEAFWVAAVERATATSEDIATRKALASSQLNELQARIVPSEIYLDDAEDRLASAQQLARDSGIEEMRSRLSFEMEQLQISLARVEEHQAAAEVARQGRTRNIEELAAARERLKVAHSDMETSKYEAAKVDESLPGLAEAVEAQRDMESKLEFARRESALVQRAREVERAEIMNDIRASTDRGNSVRQRINDIEERIVRELGIEQLEPELYSGSIKELEAEIDQHRRLVHEVGPVNPMAPQQFEEEDRYFHDLGEQIRDLEHTVTELRLLTGNLEKAVQTEFMQMFELIRTEFRKYFKILFDGGDADMVLSDPDNPAASGIDINARLPGKRVQRLEALSGGERSLVSIALLFAMFSARPGPLCVLDEVDAALDEVNTARFRRILHDFSGRTQFVVITHNPGTIEEADSIFGVSMPANGVSELVSVRMAGNDDSSAVAGVRISSGG